MTYEERYVEALVDPPVAQVDDVDQSCVEVVVMGTLAMTEESMKLSSYVGVIGITGYIGTIGMTGSIGVIGVTGSIGVTG